MVFYNIQPGPVISFIWPGPIASAHCFECDELKNRKCSSLLTCLIGHKNPINGFLPAASASCVPTPDGHANRWHGYLDFSLPTDTKSSSSLNSGDPPMKYPSCRSYCILIWWTKPMSLGRSYNAGPQILHMIFLSNTLKSTAFVLNNIHA